jgi:DNA anti-recombination protein RmuC
LVFSWLIAIIGSGIGLYLVIFKLNDVKSILIAFMAMVGEILLAGAVRTLGNIGQMLFELQLSSREENTIVNNAFGAISDALNAFIKQSFIQTSQLQEITQEVIQQNKVTNGINDTIIKSMHELNHSLNESIHELNRSLNETIHESNRPLIETIHELNRSLNESIHELNHPLIESIHELNHSLSKDLEILRRELDSLNCDSKEITQDIFQIKTFFEKIEQQLGLKK